MRLNCFKLMYLFIFAFQKWNEDCLSKNIFGDRFRKIIIVIFGAFESPSNTN